MVDGYVDTAMGNDGGGAAQEAAAATLAPRRDRSRTACWYAKRARPTAEGGRHRDGDARPCWLAGKTTYRKATYCTARPQPDEPAACCRGMAAVSHFAGLHTRAGLYLRWTKETSGRCSHAGCSACVRYYGSDGAAVQAKPCQRRANTRTPGDDDCEALLVSCAALSALPCLGGRLSCLLSAGLRQHRGASLAEAQRDAEFHVAGCRCTVGCGWRGVGSCRDDWKSLERAWGAVI
jgi:hypothetical protein